MARADLAVEATPRLLLTIAEAAAACGVDRATFYRWLRNDTLRVPLVRIGGTVRVRTADLDRVLADLACMEALDRARPRTVGHGSGA
jgi:excisionase family DNA binding protein